MGTTNYHCILAEFLDATSPAVFKKEYQNHDVIYYIKTISGPSELCRPWRLAPDRFKEVKVEFESIIHQVTARPSKIPWASPRHIVPKKDNASRSCDDNHALNARTVPERYPIPHIEDFARTLHGCKVFTTIDLVKAYIQIPVAPGDVEKTAITTPFGLFVFSRMPFGLHNAAQTFQRFIDYVLRELHFFYAYIDDI